MPLDDLSTEPTHPWIGEAFAEALTFHLRAAGGEAIRFDERVRAFGDKGFTAGVPITWASVIVVGRDLGATRAVVGSYQVEGGRTEVTVRVIDLAKGAMFGVIEDHGNVEELAELENQVARNLFRLDGGSVPSSFEESARRRSQIPPKAHESHARARRDAEAGERRKLLEEALALYPDYVEARLLLGRLLLETGEPREAITVLSSIEAGEIGYREAYFVLGLSYLGAGEPSGAAEIFSNLADQAEPPDRENQPNAAPSFNNLGVALFRLGELERAMGAFQEAHNREPEDPRYLFNLGWGAWRSGKGKEALHWFREAVRRDPEDGEAHFLLSAAATAQALPSEAEEERELGVALSPELVELDASTVKGLERVAQHFGPVTAGPADEDGNDPEEYSVAQRIERARSYSASGESEEAVKELQRALYSDPYSREARLELAALYRETGELERAIVELRMALWDQEDGPTHLRLAETYAELGNVKSALDHAQRALALDPESSEARRMVERFKDPG